MESPSKPQVNSSMNTTIAEKEKPTTHPMEEILNIEENTTIVPYKEVSTELVKHESYDKKDEEIEEQLQTIYDQAMTAFENQQEDAEMVDPKYRARNAEVAVQFLNAALQAVREKSVAKTNKDKLDVASKVAKRPTVNNNLIIDRNELLRAMIQGSDPNQQSHQDALEGEFTEESGE